MVSHGDSVVAQEGARCYFVTMSTRVTTAPFGSRKALGGGLMLAILLTLQAAWGATLHVPRTPAPLFEKFTPEGAVIILR